MNSLIKVSNLSKNFGDLEVLKDINLEVSEGEVICIIGPSGSGKSTLLRCINQLEIQSGGDIYYDGKNICEKGSDLRKYREEVGMVFQKFNLFPMKNVLKNIMLAPILTKKNQNMNVKRKQLNCLPK